MPTLPVPPSASLEAGPPARGVVLMLGASVGFAAMATCVGAAYTLDPGLSAYAASSVRAAVNLLALVILARGDGPTLWGDRQAALWARGVFGAAALIAYFGALRHLGVGEAAFLNQTSAVWVVLLSHWLLGERSPRLVWLAVLGSLVGVGLLSVPREAGGDLLGRALGLASGLFSSIAYLAVRRAARDNGPVAVVFYFTSLGTLASLAMSLGSGAAWPDDPRVWALLALSGLFATASQLAMTRAFTLSRAGTVAAASASGPLFTTAMGMLFLHQRPDAAAAVGMAILVVTGIVLPVLTERMSRV